MEMVRIVEVAKKHLKLKLIEDFGKADLYCYNESTVDGHDVWVLSSDMENIIICRDVFYYDSDVADELMDKIKYNFGKELVLHIIKYLWDDLKMDEKMLEYFSENIEKIIKDGTLGLSNEEIEWAKNNI